MHHSDYHLGLGGYPAAATPSHRSLIQPADPQRAADLHALHSQLSDMELSIHATAEHSPATAPAPKAQSSPVHDTSHASQQRQADVQDNRFKASKSSLKRTAVAPKEKQRLKFSRA